MGVMKVINLTEKQRERIIQDLLDAGATLIDQPSQDYHYKSIGKFKKAVLKAWLHI
ncbi:hypothetical protein D3C81_797880 [compost metagenome]